MTEVIIIVFCPKLDEFVTCVEEPLRTSCGNEAYALVMKAIEKYGCPSKIGKSILIALNIALLLLEVARVNEFLSLGVESSTMVISENAVMTTTSEAPESNKPEVNMLVKTSLQVDEEKTTPVELKEEVISSTVTPEVPSTIAPSSVPQTTTTTEFIENQIIGKSNDITEGSGEVPEPQTSTKSSTTVITTTEVEEVFQTRKPRKQFNAENMTDCYSSIVG